MNVRNEAFVELLLAEYQNWADELRVLLDKHREDHLQLLLDLISLSIIDRKEVAMLWGFSLGVAYVDSVQSVRLNEAEGGLSHENASRYRAICLYKVEGVASICMVDPTDVGALNQLKDALGMPVSPLFGLPDEIEQAILMTYSLEGEVDRATKIAESLPHGIEDGTIAKPVEQLEQSSISNMFKKKKKRRRAVSDSE